MFAVMGATGQTGGAAAAELRQRGAAVRALTRDPATAGHLGGDGVEIAATDPANVDSLTAAFVGIEAAYVLIPPHIDAADALAAGRETANAIAEAVTRAGVARVVALSSGGAHLSEGTGLIRTLYDLEQALRRTGVPTTFLRAADFMENWASVVPAVLAEGILPSARTPLDRKMETVSATDVGHTAAELLLSPHQGERIVNLFGPEDYSPNDAAAAFSTVLGKPVHAEPMPHEALLPAFLQGGLGEDYARGLAELYDSLRSGRLTFEPGVGETRRGSTTLIEAVRAMLA